MICNFKIAYCDVIKTITFIKKKKPKLILTYDFVVLCRTTLFVKYIQKMSFFGSLDK